MGLFPAAGNSTLFERFTSRESVTHLAWRPSVWWASRSPSRRPQLLRYMGSIRALFYFGLPRPEIFAFDVDERNETSTTWLGTAKKTQPSWSLQHLSNNSSPPIGSLWWTNISLSVPTFDERENHLLSQHKHQQTAVGRRRVAVGAVGGGQNGSSGQ